MGIGITDAEAAKNEWDALPEVNQPSILKKEDESKKSPPELIEKK